MITAEKVIEIYTKLLAHNIPIWFTGGWGIDALLGEQTRDHKDLDVIMSRDDVFRMCEIMTKRGYVLKDYWLENQFVKDAEGNEIATAFVLVDDNQCEFDVHAILIDENGNGIPVWAEDDAFMFTKAELAGKGNILRYAVNCITADSQMKCHAGYELPEKHKKDLQLLHKKYGSEYPDGYDQQDTA